MPTILFIPGKTKENEYINIFKDIFKEYLKFNVMDFGFYNYIRSSFKFNYIYVNWLENQTRNHGILGLLLIIGFLISSKILCYKIIYVQHNIKSQNIYKDYDVFINKLAIKLIKLFSLKVVTHGESYARNNNMLYIPHPIYNIEIDKNYVSQINDISERYLIFGRMSKYKKIEIVLDNLKNKKIILAGRFDLDYLDTIRKKIANERINVIIINEFIDDDELTGLIYSAKHVLISNDGECSIVSGALFHCAAIRNDAIIQNVKLIENSGQDYIDSFEISNGLYYVKFKENLDYKYSVNIILNYIKLFFME